MIIWSGRGIICALSLILFGVIGLSIFPKEYDFYAVVFSFFASAAVCWSLGNLWNNEDPKIFIEKSTGKEINVKRIHTFFWIEMQYWGIIYSILGVILLATKSITAAIICALVICAGFCYYFIKRKSGSSNIKQENTPTDKKEPSVQVETEEERLKRRQEKEDPRRFMPNFENTDNA
ncbi:MAG: hypothetical protein IKW77_12045 [Salinivirgaceae bacterium]|nr:hypothetical protein [Salinivirgaceae bacterium]